MKIRYFTIVFFLFSFFARSQAPTVLPPEYIRTIAFKSGSESGGTPIVKLGQSFRLEFDDLIGDEANYYYKIRYYNGDWTPSNLSQSEYLKGYDNSRIKSYKNSFNTLQIYTHYQLNLPNSETEAFRISGNYMLEVYDDSDEIVFSRPFIIYEDLVSIPTEIKRSRDLKYLNTHQVVNFSITSNEPLFLRDPDKNLNVNLLQNNRLQDAITNIKPQYRMGTELVYRYDSETSFKGGNEYLFFDSKDVRTTANNVQYSELKEIYHLHLYADSPRHDKVYTYNPDINGQFKISTLHGNDPSIESEYVWVYFYLKEKELLGGDEIHLYGGFNNFTTDESTLLAYNPESELYEGRYLFKQGFYNYKYVRKQKDGRIDTGFISGNFDLTENNYTVIAYYREPGSRYDRVIGIGRANSSNISN